MMGISLDHAPEVFGYSCPWCPVVVVDAGLLSPVKVFEAHIDIHIGAGHPLMQSAPVPVPPMPRQPADPRRALR